MAQSPKANRGPSAAAENRAALISAAREVFDARGAQAPLSAVAKRAGVSQGVLYRHFPTKTALALAVLEQNMERIEALAARQESTLREISDLLTHQIEGISVLVELLASAHEDDKLRAFQQDLRAIIESKWDAAQKAGVVGERTRVDDYMFAIRMIAAVVAVSPSDERHENAERAWVLLGPGLRA